MIPTPEGKRSNGKFKHDGYYRLQGRHTETPDRLHTVLLHEVQHDVQRIAGAIPMREVPDLMWARNAAEDFKIDFGRLPDSQNNLVQQHQAALVKARIIGGDPRFEINNYAGKPVHGLHVEGLPAGFNRQMQRFLSLSDALKLEEQGKDTRGLLKSINYFYKPHEIMAREVEARQHLSMPERLAIRPQLAATWPAEAPAFGPGSKPVEFFGLERWNSEKNFRRDEDIHFQQLSAVKVQTPLPAAAAPAIAPAATVVPERIPQAHTLPTAAEAKPSVPFNHIKGKPFSRTAIFTTAVAVSMSALALIRSTLGQEKETAPQPLPQAVTKQQTPKPD